MDEALLYNGHVEIAAGGTFHQDIPMTAGCSVEWKFRTRVHDISFGISISDSSNNGSNDPPLTTKRTVLAMQLINSHETESSGGFRMEKDGLIHLTWDNSYSYLTSKRLTYTIVTSPTLAQANLGSIE